MPGLLGRFKAKKSFSFTGSKSPALSFTADIIPLNGPLMPCSGFRPSRSSREFRGNSMLIFCSSMCFLSALGLQEAGPDVEYLDPVELKISDERVKAGEKDPVIKG